MNEPKDRTTPKKTNDSKSFSPFEVNPTRLNRRDFLRYAAVGFAASYTLSPLDRALAAGDPFLIDVSLPPENTFGLSIASADPMPTGVILWTRINPSAVVAGTVLGVEVASDPAFTQLILRARVPATQIGSTLDYTVRVDLNGQLQPNTIYYYRFIYNSTASRTGRCRTLPTTTDASVSKLKFAVVNCQDYTNGYYPAYNYIANDPDIDFVVHVGDFIYETVGGTSFQPGTYPDRSIDLPTNPQGKTALNIADYRFLYQTYRSDPFLRAALENFTWIVIWDDHEMANDQFHDYTNNSAGAPDHPYADDPVALRQLKFDSQQAWFEYNAARVKLNTAASDIFGRLSIYRDFKFGTLVELFMTDERTYRSPHPEGEVEYGQRYFAPASPTQTSPSQTMLGQSQRDWLVQGVTASTALWKAWGNEVLIGAFQVFLTPDVVALIAQQLGIQVPAGLDTVTNDSWDGFQFERTYLAQQFKAHNVQNLVVLTGDLHSYIASYYKIDFSQTSNTDQSNIVGVEFMTPAITSSNLQEQLGNNPQFIALLTQLAGQFNPHQVFFNSSLYGYATVEFNRSYCEYVMYVVDKTQNNAGAPRTVLKRFQTPINSNTINDVTGSRGTLVGEKGKRNSITPSQDALAITAP